MSRNTHNDLLDHEELRSAVDVPYDNSGSGLSADNVQDAIDEVEGGGGGGNGQVKVSSGDTSSAYLDTKIVPGVGIATTVLGGGGSESLEISVTGTGGALFLGGVAGSPHTGLSGAAGTDPTAAESDHQHPAQIYLTGANVGDKVVKVRYNAHAFDMLQIGLRASTGLAVIQMYTDATDGLEIAGPTPGATGDNKTKLTLTPTAGGNNPNILLNGAASFIERQGSERVLWDSQIGLDVAAEDHTHEETLVLTSNANSSSVTPADVPGLTTAAVAPGTFWVRAYLPINTAAATTGISLGISAPGTPSLAAHTIRIPISATAEETFYQRTEAMATSSGYTAGSGRMALIEGMFVTSTSGAFAVRLATEVAASQATILAGAMLVVKGVA